MLMATMPEATVDEDRHSLTSEYYVWTRFASGGLHRQVNSESPSSVVKS